MDYIFFHYIIVISKCKDIVLFSFIILISPFPLFSSFNESTLNINNKAKIVKIKL